MGEAEEALEALGNAVRRDIVRILARGPRAVGEIAEVLPISRPAVSKHLRVLEGAKLVTHVTAGKRNVFRLETRGFVAARQWLDQFWTEALTRFALLADNTAPARDAPEGKR